MLLRLLLFIFLPAFTFAQQVSDPDSSMRAGNPGGNSFGQITAPSDADVNFLFTYYEQDGNHSAVTGGTGTEELADRAVMMNINVPIDSARRFLFNSTVNHYSSASTDNINSHVSSASSKDLRIFASAGMRKENKDKRVSLEIMLGGSMESDYISLTPSFIFSHWSKNKSNRLTAGAQLFFDQWMPVFPEELRGTTHAVIPDTRRRSVNLTFSAYRAFTKKVHASLSVDPVFQQGLLSTPFHRVFFQADPIAWVENLPTFRFKMPVTLRLNTWLADFLVLRLWYRWYWDTFGIQAHSISAEVPVKITPAFSVMPFCRFHLQSASRYFVTYHQTVRSQEFYTSDYDLSGLSSQKLGLGLYFAPLYGVSRWKMLRKVVMLRELEARGAWYRRSDGLEAWMVSLGLSFRAR